MSKRRKRKEEKIDKVRNVLNIFLDTTIGIQSAESTMIEAKQALTEASTTLDEVNRGGKVLNGILSGALVLSIYRLFK